ncbi:hypothetical protein K461DRAFT_256175 [Myriangium duriaei CBS 260.36]|uniref:Spindle pole body component n=1 Tax=Myriangium duriaei CBS 260.36 TaxID=1168546 RepID=A0A9P4IZA7_9PEZI|nr:hypothetical protein K461DRAFT_256175 [Myriangium duriaei CBS 260.36]
MIQEILIALSGHASALFVDSDDPNVDATLVSPDLTDLAASEIALLGNIGQIALYHRLLKRHLSIILSSHDSLVCRAVAASLLHTHLRRFQDHILAIEKRILTEDTDIVGAYRNVPLSALVTEVNPWQRLLRWYWTVSTFITPSVSNDTGEDGQKPANSATLIDYLRQEAQTGFEDIEAAAIQLSCVAEKTWLRLTSTWLLYGRLPEHGSGDLLLDMILASKSSPHTEFAINPEMIPSIVEPQTAASILFVGKTLNQLHAYQSLDQPSHISQESKLGLVATHTAILSSLTFPLSSNALSRAIAQIRKSLSQNVLQLLLPAEEVALALGILKDFFLLENGEFAVLLIEEAHRTTQAKNKSLFSQTTDLVSSLRNLSLKDSNLFDLTTRVFRSLTNLSNASNEDDYLDRARHLLRLSLLPRSDPYARPSSNQSKFNDVLIPATRVHLTMTLPPPLDLFLSLQDISTYSHINSYLLSLRVTQLSLSSLWRHRSSPISLPAALTRQIWATASSAHLLLSTLTSHLSDILYPSFTRFREWTTSAPRDPETLASAHRGLLSTLTHALLLTDELYTTELRSLLTHSSSLVGLFERLMASTATGHADLVQGRVEVDRARKRVDAGMRGLVRRLRAVDVERAGLEVAAGGEVPDLPREGWVAAGMGVQRLLMRLDFARVGDEEEGL